MMQITCLDGTVLHVPDDDRLAEYLPGVSTDEVFYDSSKIPAASEKYITFRPPVPDPNAVRPSSDYNNCESCGQPPDAQEKLDTLRSILRD